MEYYSAIKKNEIVPFVATWMGLEIIILSEVSIQRKTYDSAYMWNLKKKRYEQTHRKNKQKTKTYDYQRGKEQGIN